jgi:hypothetical protein
MCLGIVDLQSVSFPGLAFVTTRASEMIDSDSGNPSTESAEINLTFRVGYEGNEWKNKQCDPRDGRG